PAVPAASPPTVPPTAPPPAPGPGGSVASGGTDIDVTPLLDSALTQWKVGESGGSAGGKGSVTVEGPEVVIREGDSFRIDLERSIPLPESPGVLFFEYTSLSFDTTAQHRVKDAFEVSVVDADGKSLVP